MGGGPSSRFSLAGFRALLEASGVSGYRGDGSPGLTGTGCREVPLTTGNRRCPGPCGAPSPGAVALPSCRDQRATGLLGSGTSVLHRRWGGGDLRRWYAWGVCRLRAHTLPHTKRLRGPHFIDGIGLGGALPPCCSPGNVAPSGVPFPRELAVGELMLCRWTRLAPSGDARRSRVRSNTHVGGIVALQNGDTFVRHPKGAYASLGSGGA